MHNSPPTYNNAPPKAALAAPKRSAKPPKTGDKNPHSKFCKATAAENDSRLSESSSPSGDKNKPKVWRTPIVSEIKTAAAQITTAERERALGIMGSAKTRVEPRGVEPLTSAMRMLRSTS